MDYYELSLQRKEQIETGLLELMQHTPYTQITVTILAKHMDMSRKCFYHYFSTKEACLEALIDHFIQNAAMELSPPAPDMAHQFPLYVRTLEYWKTQEVFLRAIFQNQLEAVLLQRCMHHYLTEEKALQELLQTADVEFDEDVLSFYLSSLLSLLNRWLQRGFEPPVEEMARKFQRLFQQPLIQPPKT